MIRDIITNDYLLYFLFLISGVVFIYCFINIIRGDNIVRKMILAKNYPVEFRNGYIICLDKQSIENNTPLYLGITRLMERYVLVDVFNNNDKIDVEFMTKFNIRHIPSILKVNEYGEIKEAFNFSEIEDSDFSKNKKLINDIGDILREG